MTDPIDAIWPRIREAFAFYGKKMRSPCGPGRRKLIEKRLSEGYQPDDLVRAVHGWVHFHNGLEEREGFKPRKWFDPESVFKESRFDTRVELGEHPWVYVDPKARHEKEVKDRQAAAQKRIQAMRDLSEKKLHIVVDKQ